MNQVRELWVLIGQEFYELTPEKKKRIKEILERSYNDIRAAVK